MYGAWCMVPGARSDLMTHTNCTPEISYLWIFSQKMILRSAKIRVGFFANESSHSINT